MPMGGGGDEMDWMSLLQGAGKGDGQGQAQSKFAYQQPALPYEPAHIAPLSMPQQQPLEQEQAPGWGFLRAYLGR
jgi:hypothetical protein